MLVVGLTGNAAAGKSTVARVWAEEGVPVISADELAREAVSPGSEGLARVVDAFGREILGADGSLDRARLRDVVFRDGGARARLEEILHPLIWRLRTEWMRQRALEGHRITVAEVPLLFEAGLEADFDVTVLVDAPEDLRRARLVELRGIEPGEAQRIMDAQLDPAIKRARAHHVLENTGSLEELGRSARALLTRLRRQADEGAREGSDGPRLRLDLHMHTWDSFDCLSDPDRVLARARAGGVGRIAITDHNRLGAALEMARRHPDQVIPGEEVKTAEGVDMIGLYLSEEIPARTPGLETCRRIHEQGGLVYLPHPYAAGKGGAGRWAEAWIGDVDIVEAYNGRIHDQRLNERARVLADANGLPMGAGSDAHTLWEVGRCQVDVPWHPNEPAALLGALRNGEIHGRSAPHVVHVASTWAKLRKRLPGRRGSR